MEHKKNYGKCRCCLSDGYHKDIMKEYYSNGVREVYYEMFMECYNLFLSTNTDISKLICASCVQRLRDANSFKAMAVTAEQQLLNAVGDKETVFVNVPVGELEPEQDIKSEWQVVVKAEPEDQDNGFESERDMEEQCEDVDDGVGDLVPGEAELLARFTSRQLQPLPTRATLYSTCPYFARHLDNLKHKIVTPKMIEKLLEQSRFRKPLSRKIYITEKLAHIANAAALIEYSNGTPFKSRNRTGYPCFYCRCICENLTKLREHQSKHHRKSEAKKALSAYGGECLVVYLDITDLKCTICNQNIQNLTELKSHITNNHGKKLHPKFSDRVIPFKLSDDNVFACQICGFNFETFGSIERHMNVHYRNYVCNECGTGFVTKYRLKVHVKSMHVEGSFPCELCKKVFSSQQKLKNHFDTVHKLVKRFKCPKCPERFSEYFRRQKHMTTIHGVAPLQYKCNVCDKAFDRRYNLSRHMKRDHLEERDFQCEICSYKSFTRNEMRVHMVKHNGERIFECSVCKKSYARKKTLKEHMRIHNNDRRFACTVCGQAFVQKCSLKGHIKTHHIEYS